VSSNDWVIIGLGMLWKAAGVAEFETMTQHFSRGPEGK
jgi:hypothetical protein